MLKGDLQEHKILQYDYSKIHFMITLKTLIAFTNQNPQVSIIRSIKFHCDCRFVFLLDVSTEQPQFFDPNSEKMMEIDLLSDR